MFGIFSDESYKDKYLYHYTTIENALMYILPQKRLRFSPSNETNDPQEISDRQYQIADDLNLGNQDKIFDEFLINQRKFSDSLINDMKLLCFAQDSTNNSTGDPRIGRGFVKPRMWAQYAGNHTGVCMIINKQRLINFIKNIFDGDFIKFGDVSYSNDYIKSHRTIEAYTLKTSELKKHTIQEVTMNRINSYFDIYYFSKHPDWAEENEYRIIMRYSKEKYAYIDIDGCLEGIVLGVKYDENLINPLNIMLDKYEYRPKISKLIYFNNSYMAVPIDCNM